MKKLLWKNIIIASVMILCCGFALSASGSQETAQDAYGGVEGKITVYLSGPAVMLDKLEMMFEKEHGDVLDFVHMGCGPLRQRIWTESETGMINADVFWGSDPLLFKALDDEGALDDYKPDGLENLDEKFITDGNYTLVNERYGVVIYNKNTVAEVPGAFNDLADEKYNRKICHADPAQSSTALALIAGLWDLYGEEGDYYRDLKENGLLLTKKNSDVPSKIQEGEYDAGIAPHDAVFRLCKKAKKEGYPTPLAICWPEEGAVAIQRPIAISRNAARPEVNQKIAEDFIDFMISKDAQKVTVGAGFISARKDLPAPAGIPEDLKTIRLDWTQLADSQNIINEDFKKLFR